LISKKKKIAKTKQSTRKKLINSQKNKMSPIWQLKFSQSPEIELAKTFP